MKKIMILTLGLTLNTMLVTGNDNRYKSFHGTNSFISETGSGYGLSNSLNFYVQEFNRIFELGVICNIIEPGVNGLEFNYKHFLGFRSANRYHKPLRPYVYYNFIYRLPATVIASPALKSASGDAFGNSKITSFEHYIGIGTQLKLIKEFYFEANTGLGTYLGTRYRGAAPNTWGIHLNNHGFVPSVKMGFGLLF